MTRGISLKPENRVKVTATSQTGTVVKTWFEGAGTFRCFVGTPMVKVRLDHDGAEYTFEEPELEKLKEAETSSPAGTGGEG